MSTHEGRERDADRGIAAGSGASAPDRDEEGTDHPLHGELRVRQEDLEPHAGLRYIARLFKVLALLLLLLLVAEVVIGLMREGRVAVPTLLIEATRLIVFAGLLWGAGDMALMLIESNHDLRATRILVGRLNYRVQRVMEHMNVRDEQAEQRARERQAERVRERESDRPPR